METFDLRRRSFKPLYSAINFCSLLELPGSWEAWSSSQALMGPGLELKWARKGGGF